MKKTTQKRELPEDASVAITGLEDGRAVGDDGDNNEILHSMSQEENAEISRKQRAAEKAAAKDAAASGKTKKKPRAGRAESDDSQVAGQVTSTAQNIAADGVVSGDPAADAAAVLAEVEELKKDEGEALPEAVPEDETDKKLLLRDITDRLKELVIKDKGNWMRQYQLMAEVREKQLYKTMKNRYGDIFSFKKWVSYLAETLGFNVSLLWARLDAGQTLDAYVRRVQAREDAERKTEQNSEAAIEAKMQMIKVAPDNICFARRVARGNKDVEDELIGKLIDGVITRRDLKIALEKVKEENAVARRIKRAEKWQKENAEREAAVAAGKITLSEDEKAAIAAQKNLIEQQLQRDIAEQAEIDARLAAEAEAKTTASEIVQCFEKAQAYWISQEIRDVGQEDEFFILWYDHAEDLRKYKVFPEFAVRTAGTSHYARRIDALILENYSIRKHELGYAFTTHAIEIKISVSDFLNDKKLDEYREFADFAWLAIPANDAKLLQAAKDNLSESWGILLVDTKEDSLNSIKVERVATRNTNNLKRDIVYATAIQKLL